MPVKSRLAENAALHAGWRRDLHAIPELLYDLPETSRYVAERLRAIGCDEVAEGIGGSGVVGLLEGRGGPGRTIALRADMDALPIEEETDAPHRSRHPGRMHACGHDGHMAMLLAAAETLAEGRRFSGRVALVFQPAEEGGAGARAMIEDGLLARFAIEAVFGMHNIPGLPLGRFAIRPGPIMAATDEFAVRLRGRGGHAAIPQQAADPILAGAALVQALQQIVSRNADPLDALVVSVTQFHAGFARNVIPADAAISGTVRSLSEETRTAAERRIREIAAGVAAAHGIEAETDYVRHYPVTRNHAAEAEFCATVAELVAGAGGVERDVRPLMGGEDFSFMLNERPGAFIFVGNGDSAGLHNPGYDFNDEAIPFGASYWVELVERALPPEA